MVVKPNINHKWAPLCFGHATGRQRTTHNIKLIQGEFMKNYFSHLRALINDKNHLKHSQMPRSDTRKRIYKLHLCQHERDCQCVYLIRLLLICWRWSISIDSLFKWPITRCNTTFSSISTRKLECEQMIRVFSIVLSSEHGCSWKIGDHTFPQLTSTGSKSSHNFSLVRMEHGFVSIKNEQANGVRCIHEHKVKFIQSTGRPFIVLRLAMVWPFNPRSHCHLITMRPFGDRTPTTHSIYYF